MSMDLTVQFDDRVDPMKASIRAGLVGGLKSAGEYVAGNVRQEAPKRTGALAMTIDSEVDADDLSATVASGSQKAFYPHLVEYGTVHSRANPFMHRGMDKSFDGVERILRSSLP